MAREAGARVGMGPDYDPVAGIERFRAPDSLHLAPAPLCTHFVDIFDAMDRLRTILEPRDHPRFPVEPTLVI